MSDEKPEAVQETTPRDKNSAGKPERQNKVARMYWEFGMTEQEIANQLKVSRDTIVRDIKALRKQIPNAVKIMVKDPAVLDVFYKNFVRHNAIIDEGYLEFRRLNSGKIQAGKNLSAIIKDNIFVLQQTGGVETVATKLEHSGTINTSMIFDKGLELARARLKEGKKYERHKPSEAQKRMAKSEYVHNRAEAKKANSLSDEDLKTQP